MSNDELLKRGSPERFGHSWGIYHQILPIHEEQFLRWTTGFSRQDWQGKSFLDVGCGIGRNAYWPLSYGARDCLAIDVDHRTLDAAKRNLSSFPTACVEYRSAYDIQEHNRFDIAFSIGVIHHLEDPERAVRNMVAATRPGGKVLVWLYGYEGNEWIVRYFNPFRTAIFSRLPSSVTHALSLPLTALLWLAVRLGLGKSDYFKLLKRFTFNHLRAIVYDHMLPETAHYYTREEACRLLANAGLSGIEARAVNQISWTVIGTKEAGMKETVSETGEARERR